MKKKIALVFGTRPEIIKLSGIIRIMQREKRPFFMIHTGQHYSYEMDRLFFKQLELPEPRFQLECRSRSALEQAEHAGRMMAQIETILLKERPDCVLVQGDTNSVLAGSMATAKITGMRLGHVEAGLRSYDRQMPEEINRVLSDHVSDFLFPPTKGAAQTLKKEGIPGRQIFVTGNTIVDAVLQNLAIAKQKKLDLPPGTPDKGYILMTLHRQESVDRSDRLRSIFRALELVHRRFAWPILFPAHPRTVKRLEEFHIPVPGAVRILNPVGFLEFLQLERNASLILTDSGGVQEEACILKVPCVTLRTSTERPETVRAGANIVAGYDPQSILKAAVRMVRRKKDWLNPFGNGKSSEKILSILDRS